MRPCQAFLRGLSGWAALAFATALALCLAGCGPEAIGVDACRKIESARCDAAAACGFDEAEVADCKLLYTDQCLHGIENKDHRPTETETEACVAAVTAAGDCAADGVPAISGCAGAPLVAGAKDRSPCDIVLSHAEDLSACAFAVPDAEDEDTTGTSTDTGTDTTTSSSTDSTTSTTDTTSN
ncbi:MAG: hypothetical protein R3B70_24905 [Polyangiaceae bacterium]